MKPISILLIEDDKNSCDAFKNYIDTKKDIVLVGSTGSCLEAITLFKIHLPDAIILDLDLHKRRRFRA